MPTLIKENSILSSQKETDLLKVKTGFFFFKRTAASCFLKQLLLGKINRLCHHMALLRERPHL